MSNGNKKKKTKYHKIPEEDRSFGGSVRKNRAIKNANRTEPTILERAAKKATEINRKLVKAKNERASRIRSEIREREYGPVSPEVKESTRKKNKKK